MNIVIIGNIKTNADDIKSIAEKLAEAGIGVRYPAFDMPDVSADSEMVAAFERIDWADFVIAIPRDGLTFSHATTSEIAYAKYRKKPVLIYYN